MRGGVAVRRVVAAADVAAARAHSQVDPAAADLQTVLAAGNVGRQVRDGDRVEMEAGSGHRLRVRRRYRSTEAALRAPMHHCDDECLEPGAILGDDLIDPAGEVDAALARAL